MVGVGLLAFLLHRAGWASLWDLASRLAPLPLLAAAAVCLCNLLVAAVRFRALLDAPLELKGAMRIYFTGYLFNYFSVVPGFGSGVKASLLWKDRVGLARSLATVGGEVLLDIVFCGVAGALFLAFHSELLAFPRTGGRALWALALAAAGFAVLLGISFLAARERFVEALRSLGRAGRYLLRPGILAGTAGLTVLSWTLVAATARFLFAALGASPPFFDLLGGICIGVTGGLLSLIPAGLGVREGIWAYLFSRFGIAFSTCMLVAVLQRILYLVLATALWAVLRSAPTRGCPPGPSGC
jgi:uncharacterized membrane protein YbhN (UPF0104 family)